MSSYLFTRKSDRKTFSLCTMAVYERTANVVTFFFPISTVLVHISLRNARFNKEGVHIKSTFPGKSKRLWL